MTRRGPPTTPAPRATSPGPAVGHSAAPPTALDLEQLTVRVYQLLMDDLRQDLARRSGRSRSAP